MFEGKIPRSGGIPAGADAGFDADGLRPLAWDELVARLGAARELRRAMGACGAEGSFDKPSARHLAALGEGQRGINPFALNDRKMASATQAGPGGKQAATDRGRT